MHQSLSSVKRQWSHGTFRRFCYLKIFFCAGVRSGSCYRPRLVYNISSKDLAYAFKQERMASCLEKYVDAPFHTTPGQSIVSSLKLTIRQCSKCSKLHITNNVLLCIRGTQRDYSSKPLKHSIVKRILVFKR